MKSVEDAHARAVGDMHRTRIKICCIASCEEAAAAIAAGADAVGLVGPMPSGPGPIDDETALAVARTVGPPTDAWLLTAESEPEAIAGHAARCGVRTVQLVRHVPPNVHAVLARTVPWLRRVQVVHVEGAEALGLIDAYAANVHVFLLDSGRPSAEELGGTGRVHDWAVSAAFVRRSPRPVFLAGGLDPANVAGAAAAIRPFGIDVCSGVRSDGALDRDKLAAFVAAVRGADAAFGKAGAAA